MERTSVESYRDLLVWQVGMEISVLCYQLTDVFPKREQYGITSQIRRAAVSIPANISEGYGRATRREYIRFLRIAQGSLKELETLIEISRRVALLSDAEKIKVLCDREGRLLTSLIRSLNRRTDSPLPTPDSRSSC